MHQPSRRPSIKHKKTQIIQDDDDIKPVKAPKRPSPPVCTTAAVLNLDAEDEPKRKTPKPQQKPKPQSPVSVLPKSPTRTMKTPVPRTSALVARVWKLCQSCNAKHWSTEFCESEKGRSEDVPVPIHSKRWSGSNTSHILKELIKSHGDSSSSIEPYSVHHLMSPRNDDDSEIIQPSDSAFTESTVATSTERTTPIPASQAGKLLTGSGECSEAANTDEYLRSVYRIVDTKARVHQPASMPKYSLQ